MDVNNERLGCAFGAAPRTDVIYLDAMIHYLSHHTIDRRAESVNRALNSLGRETPNYAADSADGVMMVRRIADCSPFRVDGR